MSTWHGEPFEDKADGKEHSESQNEQQVIGSNQNNRPVNLSAQVQDVNKTCGLVSHASILLVSHLVESTVNITVHAKRKAGRTTKKLLYSDPINSMVQLEASSPIENYYTLRKLSPCWSVLSCKHAECKRTYREKQRLLSGSQGMRKKFWTHGQIANTSCWTGLVRHANAHEHEYL